MLKRFTSRSRILLVALLALLTLVCLTGCGGTKPAQPAGTAQGKEKVFVYGTTAYGPEMSDAGLNPHDSYSGWSAVRYGVGETLFKFDDAMKPVPWLATKFERLDDYTLKIYLRDNVTFTSGRKLDGAAVKECLDDLLAKHDRAPKDLQIKEIKAEGQTVTITSKAKVPALLNYLSDPYGAIIDMKAGVSKDKNVAGTGPFVAQKVGDKEITLVKNKNYWGGTVKMDKVIVRTITDGDTLTMALQSGEIDATQGLPYASLALFQDKAKYNISSVDTSRSFFAALNFSTPALQDIRVRKAIAMGIDKYGFTKVLLKSNGTPAVGAFPASFAFGDKAVKAPGYDPEGAKKLLAEAGWKDTNGDGFVDKYGQNLTIRWLTYPGRKELPLLAESVQATLKSIGIDVKVNSTANHRDFLKRGEWDIYASALVTAPTGDPAYFFTATTLASSVNNRGKYHSDNLEALAQQMAAAFDPAQRAQLAVQMQQQILDDAAFIFASHLKMSFVMKKNVTGFVAHPSDYYEITADLDKV
jgi:peptide/nickel transport system substrate-binding protein